MKFIEPGALEYIRSQRQCWWCGALMLRCEAAHIFGRGAGEVTIRENLWASCGPFGCHYKSHYSGEPTRTEQLEMSAAWFCLDPAAIELAVYAIRRLPNGSEAEAQDIVRRLRDGTSSRNGSAGPVHRPGRRQGEGRLLGDLPLGASGDPRPSLASDQIGPIEL